MPEYTTALVLDASDADRAQLHETLSAFLGFSTIHHAASVDEAIDALKHQPIDLVLSAWHVGSGTAHRLFRYLSREFGPRLPRVMLVDGESTQALRLARQERVSDYLRKPLERDALLRTVARLRSQTRPCTGGMRCELDLGFDDFNSYGARLLALAADACLMRTLAFKNDVGQVGDFGSLAIAAEGEPPLLLHGRIASVRPCESSGLDELEVGFTFEQVDSADRTRIEALVRRCREGH